jgi:hypothetical protein
MRRLSRCAHGLVALTFSMTAFGAGGNVVITGHDDDFHASGCSGGAGSSPAAAQLAAMVAFARLGAPTPAKPVLSFDHGTELTTCLTNLAIPFTNIDPDVGVPAASNFNVANFSAMVVASDSTCGGCDNTSTSIANLTAASAAIGAFLNAGGGIVALAGASNAPTYYGFIPATASGFGSPPSSGYVQTAYGASISVPAVNGNPTHNFFNNPGTSGVSSAYSVVETLGVGGTAETLGCSACTTGSLGGGPSPTPTPTGAPASTPEVLAFTGVMLIGMVWFLRRRYA